MQPRIKCCFLIGSFFHMLRLFHSLLVLGCVALCYCGLWASLYIYMCIQERNDEFQIFPHGIRDRLKDSSIYVTRGLIFHVV
jgi:hypothetical protein